MTLVPVQVLGRGDNTFTPLHSLHSDLHLLLYNVKFGKFEPVGFVSFLHLVCIVHAEKHKIEYGKESQGPSGSGGPQI